MEIFKDFILLTPKEYKLFKEITKLDNYIGPELFDDCEVWEYKKSLKLDESKLDEYEFVGLIGFSMPVFTTKRDYVVDLIDKM